MTFQVLYYIITVCVNAHFYITQFFMKQLGEQILLKQLTIAVPAYNAGPYIEKCLSSMIGLDPRLEIIVVNDGSTDETEDLVRAFMEKAPEQVRLISKENGGHGSGINAAIDCAEGRYFKVIDADDWIVSENLVPLLDALEKTSADAVINAYQTVNMTSGKTLTYPTQCKYAGMEISVEQLLEVYEEISSCCSFHGLLYRTEMYRQSGIRLTEGIFYEDQEYATLPFACVETVLILPELFYVYMLGNANQSVAFHNQVKRIGHIEAVTRSILAFRKERGPLTPARDEYFLRKLAIVVVSYFSVALIKNPDRRTGNQDAKRFRAWLEGEEPELLRRTAKKYKTMKLLRLLHMPPELYQGILDTRLYKKFRRIWTN